MCIFACLPPFLSAPTRRGTAIRDGLASRQPQLWWLTEKVATARLADEEFSAAYDPETDTEAGGGLSWISPVSAADEQATMVDLASIVPCLHPSLDGFVICGIGPGVAMPETLPTD